MNTQQILSLYETISDITEQMLAAARNGEWDLFTELEAQCSRRVVDLQQNDLPREPLTLAAREKKIKVIKKILADDREIRTITDPWMAQLSSIMNSTSTTRKLSNAYGANQAG